MKKKYKNLYEKVDEFIIKTEGEAKTPLYKMSPDEARKFLNDFQALTHKNTDAEIIDTEVITTEAGNVPIRFIRPQNKPNEKLPLIIYAHGGGWIMGDENTHDELVRKLANNTNCCIAFIKYIHSPLAGFPVAFNQVYAAMNYLYNNPEQYNIDSSKIILAGDSAGANMAAACAIKAKNESGPNILMQILLYPALNPKMDTKSYSKFKDGPWLTKKAMEWFWNAYLQDKKHYENYYAAPCEAELKDLKGVAPALIITAENDVLRNEGEKYARQLDKAGVDVSCIRILGTCHDFMMLNALADTGPTKMAFDIVFAVINKALK